MIGEMERPLLALSFLGLSAAACSRMPATGSAAGMTPSNRVAGAAVRGDAQSAPGLTSTTSKMVLVGDSLFNNNSCKKCHGIGGVGGKFAPDLTQGPWIQIAGEYADIVRIITNGVPPGGVRDTVHHPFDMHPRGGSNFSDEQIRDIAAYVWTISRHKT
jgi:mono/diheme cytochrome c family protein